jgi:hypothetical protein
MPVTPAFARRRPKERPDPYAGLDAMIARAEAETGIKIDPEAIGDQTFLEWCEALAEQGMKVDGKPFNLKDRPALRPLYEAIPSTREEAKNRIIVVMKATQLGLTVWEVLANIYMAWKWAPVTIGMFMPDQATASYKSEHRFMRIVRSIPEIYRKMTVRADEGKDRKVGEGNVLTRTLGESIFLFLWTSGKVSTESRPMDVVTLDEVQEMTLDQIDKVQHRTGDSDIALTLMLSTANMPDLDIDFWYQLGNREVWHTECESCGALSDLSDPATAFPSKSIGYNTGEWPGAPLNEYVWTCPSCRAWIKDPQRGRYVETRPQANPLIRSLLVPRTISPRETPRKMAESWARAKTGDQKKSFYNRTLARPYIDPEQLPVTLDHCKAAVELGRQFGVKWQTRGRDTFMGIDQMGGFNAVIIKKRLPSGHQAVVHVEAVFDIDPFNRCDELMEQFGVNICVVEQLPNVNDARKFAVRHPGRVFLAGYANLRDDAIVWGDQLSRSDKKTTDEDRMRYTVTLQQYKCMQRTLFRVRDLECLFPDPDELVVPVLENGVEKRIPILRDWVFDHFTKTAVVVEQKEDERKPVGKVKKLGLDPHYSFAAMLCDVAYARSHGTTTFILPEAKNVTQEQRDKAAAMDMHGLPTGVIQMLEDLPAGVCGRCSAFPRDNEGQPLAEGLCAARALIVGKGDPSCDIFLDAGS